MKIKIVRVSEKEKQEFIKEYSKKPEYTEESCSNLLKEIDNQSMFIIRQVKNAYTWDDIEDMVSFSNIIKTYNTEDDECDLSFDEINLLKKVFKGSVKEKKINGMALEKYTQIYETFKG